jgi:hypothetical protein
MNKLLNCYKYYFIILVILLFPVFVFAQEEVATTTEEVETVSGKTGVIIEPFIIDEKLKAKEIRDYVVRINNQTDRYLNLYPVVSDVNQIEGDEINDDIYSLDKNRSLTRWIKFKRGVIELAPGESTEVDLNIQVALNAQPGKYFASISFPDASGRATAEEKMLSEEQPHLLINVEIEENIIEQARVVNFNTDKNVYLEFPVDFNIEIENSGNKSIYPEGSIFIYNRRGAEVANLELSTDNFEVGPGESNKINVEWSGDKKLGKFQAKLELKYGVSKTRDMQSSFFFWVLPWPILSIMLGVLFVVVFALTWILFRRSYRLHHHVVKHDPQSSSDGVLNLKK